MAKLVDFVWMADGQTKLTLHLVPFSNMTSGLCAEIRDVFIQAAERHGYTGYSRAFDEPFHRNSVYVATVDGNSKIVMTSRIGTPVGNRISFELGIHSNGSRYSRRPNEMALDLTTYTHAPGYYERAWRLHCAGLCRYIMEVGLPRSYCLYDIRNQRTLQAYREFGFELSTEFPDPIHFTTVERVVGQHREPVWWRIMEWAPARVAEHAKAGEARTVADPHWLITESVQAQAEFLAHSQQLAPSEHPQGHHRCRVIPARSR